MKIDPRATAIPRNAYRHIRLPNQPARLQHKSFLNPSWHVTVLVLDLVADEPATGLRIVSSVNNPESRILSAEMKTEIASKYFDYTRDEQLYSKFIELVSIQYIRLYYVRGSPGPVNTKILGYFFPSSSQRVQ